MDINKIEQCIDQTEVTRVTYEFKRGEISSVPIHLFNPVLGKAETTVDLGGGL